MKQPVIAPNFSGKHACSCLGFTWEEISAKFDKLVTGHVGAQLSQNIKDAVRSLEDVQLSDLTKLLREIN